MNRKIKVMTVFGTRPEAIKMAPLALELSRREEFEHICCVTAQHREMLDSVLALFSIKPDHDLNIMAPRQTLSSITEKVLAGLDGVLEQEKPDIVLVHGDTSTTFAGALAAFYHKVTVGHVEAGLRTYDKYSPFPEEMNRNLVSKIADLHFCPTVQNKANLAAEAIAGEAFITGNTAIDAVHLTVKDEYKFKSAELKGLLDDGKRIILMTAHRRENYGEPLRNICSAAAEIASKFPDTRIIYPVHLSPVVRETAKEILGNIPNVSLIEPLDFDDNINLMARCTLVMTDSGGLQEEAPSLGKPVLVLRHETERPEAVEAGTVKLAGVDRDTIVGLASELLSDENAYNAMAHAVNPYGDGFASRRTADAIAWYFNREGNRPDEFRPR